jgi:hypothetical protein
MLFITIDHYLTDTDTIVENDIPNECFICLEKETLRSKIMQLREIEKWNYIKKCDCSGSIHLKCLAKWYIIQKKCPICRQLINKLVNKKETMYYSNDFLQIILFYIVKKILIFIKILCFFISFYFFYDSFYTFGQFNSRRFNK